MNMKLKTIFLSVVCAMQGIWGMQSPSRTSEGMLASAGPYNLFMAQGAMNMVRARDIVKAVQEPMDNDLFVTSGVLIKAIGPLGSRWLVNHDLLHQSVQEVEAEATGVVLTKKIIVGSGEPMREMDVKYFIRHFAYNGTKPAQDGKKIILLAVHGTNTSFKKYGVDVSRSESQGLFNFARVLSYAYGRSVELISFNWRGDLDRDVRKAVGLDLGSFVKSELAMGDVDQLWSVAHSHGCNVVNYALTKFDDISMNIIHIASPDVDADVPMEELKEKANTRWWNFYSTGDVVQVLGSIESRRTLARKLSLWQAYNCRVQLCAQGVSHGVLTNTILEQLPLVLATVRSNYTTYRDLDINLFKTSSGMQPCVVIRHVGDSPIGETSFEEVFGAEVRYSQKQEQYFEDLYGWPIGTTEGIIGALATEGGHYGRVFGKKFAQKAQTGLEQIGSTVSDWWYGQGGSAAE